MHGGLARSLWRTGVLNFFLQHRRIGFRKLCKPGQQIGEFYFACEFTPDRDTRITRRFEAEAREPLLAVAAVLRQIDEWLPRR